MEGQGKRSIMQEAGAIEREALRFGLRRVKSDLVGSHPLESSYRSVQTKRTEEEMKRRILANTYGTAFLLRSIWTGLRQFGFMSADSFQRPTGAIPSSMLGLEAFMGNLDNSGLEDYLNDPCESKCFRLLDMLHGMEDRLGISKGPVFPSIM